jgi:Flp pilus assembly protein protease CpaA
MLRQGALDMKFVGFLLLVTGWLLVLAAIVLLDASLSRAVFVLAGIGVEALGLSFVIRSHLILREDKR